VTSLPDPRTYAAHLIEALGGHEAARKKLDVQFEYIASRWNQDANLIGRLLRSHLFVEHFLTQYLSARNPNLGDVELARLSFAQKIALADRPNTTEAYLFTGIRHLNRVRNRVAHTLTSGLTDSDRDVFLGVPYFRELRDALAAPRVPSPHPIDVLEDFARHAGIMLAVSVSPDAEIWKKSLAPREEGSGDGVA
jgi:hypothetical protein